MRAALRLFILLILPFAAMTPASAEEQDVAATERAVVRVVIAAARGSDVYFVGHASGIAVAPDKVLTNAHVVEILQDEPGLVLGVVPSQGKRSYGGRVVAFSPGNDLALIQLTEGRLPTGTFFSGAVKDGQKAVAIGYPGAVDRAQGLSINDVIKPMSPIKTYGNVSTGRASRDFDTVLHTAPMAQGNSGGPLVDECGRIIGINSFGSLSDGNDAEFGFAVSNREIASFLRQAKVQFDRTAAECRTMSDLEKEEQERAAAAAAKQAEQARKQEQQQAQARDTAEQEIYSARENAIVIAALLLALAVLALGGAGLLLMRDRRRHAIGSGVAALVLLCIAVYAYLSRPAFSEIDERARAILGDKARPAETAGYDPVGRNLCVLDAARSRVTISDAKDLTFDWSADGCVRGATQYGPDGSIWSRIFVPETEAEVRINSFDTQSGTYKTERFLPDADTMDRARELRARFKFEGCTGDAETLARLSQMQSEIRGVLPDLPNERLVYNCRKSAATPADPRQD